MELGYCCINTNARNFAKLGQLMLQDGIWNGDTLVSPEYVKMMYEPVFVDYYGYSTWIGVNAPEPFYYFRGHLGQFVIVVPDQNMVVVRLGKTVGQGKVEDNLNSYINAAIQIVGI
jgi:CubicO group peptidase (beta-lactamase class C family)